MQLKGLQFNLEAAYLDTICYPLSGTAPYASSDERLATSEMLHLIRDRTHFSARTFVFRMLLGIMPGDFFLCIGSISSPVGTYSKLLLLALASTGITSHDFKLGWKECRACKYRQRATQTSASVCFLNCPSLPRS